MSRIFVAKQIMNFTHLPVLHPPFMFFERKRTLMNSIFNSKFTLIHEY